MVVKINQLLCLKPNNGSQGNQLRMQLAGYDQFLYDWTYNFYVNSLRIPELRIVLERSSIVKGTSKKSDKIESENTLKSGLTYNEIQS